MSPVPAPGHDAKKHQIDKLFELMAAQRASDLHLKFGQPPVLRVSGALRALKMEPLDDRKIKKLVYEILLPEQIKLFEEKGSLDFGHEFSGGRRVRVNASMQRGHLSAAARLVQHDIPSFEALHLPPVLEQIASRRQGLVLVCGATGSGKSTTLAALVQHINTNRRCHILTIEDPIEYSFQDGKSFINQRELGLDVPDWDQALKFAVREDPDVILVGEMRDADTFAAGLTCAETGHLVLGTMHSSNAAQTFARILDLFPADKHPMIREQLASNLRALVCQLLVPCCKEGVGMVPAVEIMVTSPSIRSLILRGEENKIAEVVRGGKTDGMQDLTQSLGELVSKDLVLRKVALEHAPNKEQLQMSLRGISVDAGRIIG